MMLTMYIYTGLEEKWRKTLIIQTTNIKYILLKKKKKKTHTQNKAKTKIQFKRVSITSVSLFFCEKKQQ